MLLDPGSWELQQCSIDVLPRLSDDLRDRLSVETQLAVVEYASDPAQRVGDAIAQLAAIRARLADELRGLGLAVGAAGTHPFTLWTDTEVTPRERYEEISRTMGELARREPTFAQHVHVGVRDPELAIRLLNRLRLHVPVLLALSANSPFWQGRDTRLASARIPIWGAFPRTGIPRRFDDYDHYVRVVGELLRCGAFADHSYLWWDVRPKPEIGTVEVRIADVQTRLQDAAAIAALVQAVARLELEEGWAPEPLLDATEVLQENRFLASRDGMEAELVDLGEGCTVPVRQVLDGLLEAARPHAQDLGCEAELDLVAELAANPGAERQRRLAGGGSALSHLVEHLADAYAAPAPVAR